MGNLVDQLQEAVADAAPEVRCPVCGADNRRLQYCKHVRWTFDQGGPLDFARFALETSPYTDNRNWSIDEIPAAWWEEHGDEVVDQVLLHFDASDGYVFGEVADLDNLARELWKAFRPDPLRPRLVPVDPQ